MRWLAALGGIFSSPPAIDAEAARTCYQQGMELRNRNSNYWAARYLRSAAEAGHSEAAFQLSLILAGRGREQQRLDWLRRAAEFARNEGQPASTVARYLRQAGQAEQAEDALRQAAGTGDATAASDLGSMLTGAGRLEEGERYYRLAAERGNRAAARYLGDAALRAGRDGEAERYLRAAAEGGSSKDQIALADFLVGKSRIDEALPLLHKLGEHAVPGNLRTMGSLFRRAGLDRDAQKYYDRANEWDKLLDALDGVDDSPP